MFKILIVDDEKIVLDAVKFILDNNFSDRVSYTTARSGREAIEKSDLFNPDIIMMDIRMPGINGIEAIKEIKNMKPKVHFIIVSAYEQFDFAKEAVELKVDDYILKPIIKKTLVNVLNNAMDKIDGEKDFKRKELENIEKQESIMMFLEDSFVYSIMHGEHYGLKLDKYREILGLNEEGGYVVLLELDRRLRASYDEDEIGFIEEEHLHSQIQDAFKCKSRCFVGPVLSGRVLAVILTNSIEESVQKVEGIEISEYVKNRLQSNNLVRKIKIGIGNYKKLEELVVSYDEAFMAVKSNVISDILHFTEIKPLEKSLSIYPQERENKLLDKITLGDLEGALHNFDRLYAFIYENYGNVFEIGKYKLMELFVVIQRAALIKGFENDETYNYLVEINKYEDYTRLEKWCRDRLIYIVSNAGGVSAKKNNRIIINAKEFIYENYHREITLEDVAKETNVSPHYLSRLFKEETGENFIEFITVFRIKKAKKMLDTTNLSIKEICYKIGYTDPNYFSRLFKKIEKITPTDYMKNLNN